MLLQIAKLPRSTYFYHQARLRRPDRHATLDQLIRQVHADVKGRYGHRRIHRAVTKAGQRVAKKTVLARMRVLGLSCQIRRRSRFSTYRGAIGTTAPNRLDRCFTTEHPNQVWVTDITELRVGEAKRYLSPIMDLFDRQIIAYTLGSAPTLELTTTALRQALDTLGPDQHPLVHSDQGFHYQHRTWQALLAGAGATQSMSRKGNCLDNAVIESFFGHLKTEVSTESFATIAELETAIHAYLHWYNHERTSATLQGLSPVQYRAQAGIT